MAFPSLRTGIVERIGNRILNALGEDFLEFLGDDAIACGVGFGGRVGHSAKMVSSECASLD